LLTAPSHIELRQLVVLTNNLVVGTKLFLRRTARKETDKKVVFGVCNPSSPLCFQYMNSGKTKRNAAKRIQNGG
jgi:hypothetical protein